MPQLVRLYIHSVLVGLAAAAAFTAALIAFDVAGIGGLIWRSDMGFVAVAMLVLFNTVVFSGVQFGIRVMAMAEERNEGGGGPGASITEHDARAVPVPVHVNAGPSRRRQTAR
ncbi:MAG TPA: hypothetical protein PKD10_11560 [Paracoccaceae bacterium]|nr:hypothetical protein [Paracoccaceae bacterium]HMO71956.1 hypothetical protein [Paracoccaceae bacterium]